MSKVGKSIKDAINQRIKTEIADELELFMASLVAIRKNYDELSPTELKSEKERIKTLINEI